MNRKITINQATTALFVILFLYTGLNKLMDYSVLKEEIAGFALLSPVSSWLAAVLPWFEFLVALSLIIPKWRLRGFYTTLVLMIIFTGYISLLLAAKRDVSCGCGGVIEWLSLKQHLFLNILLVLLASYAIKVQIDIQRSGRMIMKNSRDDHSILKDLKK